MTEVATDWIDVGIGVGITRRKPLPSRLWVQLQTFHYKKDAIAWATEHGFAKSSVTRRYGRFEYAYVIVSVTSILATLKE